MSILKSNEAAVVAPRFGLTPATVRGRRTVYRLQGQEGLTLVSMHLRFSTALPQFFSGELVSVPLNDVAVETLSASQWVAHHDREDGAFPSRRLTMMLFVGQGSVTCTSARGGQVVQEGQSLVLDMGAAFRLSTTQGTSVGFLIMPSAALRMRQQQLDDVALRTLEDDAASRLCRRMIDALAVDAPADNTLESELLSHAMVDIARARLLVVRRDEAEPEAELPWRIRDLIELHYADPRLAPSVLAAKAGISERRLHRAFEDEEDTVAQAIRRRRVDAVATELLLTQEGFAEIARRAGFGSVDSAYRAFKKLKGVTPAAYRRGTTPEG